MSGRALGLLPLTLVLGLGSALAHGDDARRALLEVDGAGARLVVTPGPEALAAFDADGDGRLSPAEIAARRDALEAFLDEALVLTDAAGRRPRRTFADVVVPLERDDHHHVSQARIVRRFAFDEAPGEVTLRFGFDHGGAPLQVGCRFRGAGPGIASRLEPGQTVSFVPGDARVHAPPGRQAWAGLLLVAAIGGSLPLLRRR